MTLGPCAGGTGGGGAHGSLHLLKRLKRQKRGQCFLFLMRTSDSSHPGDDQKFSNVPSSLPIFSGEILPTLLE